MTDALINNDGLQQMRIDNTNSRLAEIKRAERAAKAKAQAAKLDEAAEEFEAVFLAQMLQHMFAGVETDELFGGGQAEDVYRSMMLDEYAKLMARTGGIGVADHVKREMLRLQEIEGGEVILPPQEETYNLPERDIPDED